MERRAILRGIGGLAAAAVTGVPGRTSPDPARRGGVTVLAGTSGAVEEAVLFAFDDVSIPFTRNLRLSMRRPERHPANPVLPRGPAGAPDEFGVQFYGSVVRDEGRFRAWYVAMDGDFSARQTGNRSLRPAYAESADGIRWSRPELGLVEFRGSRKNNLVAIEPLPLNMINLKVLVEPGDPDPKRRYKMTAHTWWWDGARQGSGTLAPLVSADGLRWRLAIDARPVNGFLPVGEMLLPRHPFEAAGGLYRWNGVYHATGQSTPPNRGDRVATAGEHGVTEYYGREVLVHRSPDFVHWSDTANVAFVRDAQRQRFRYGEGEEAHEGVSVWHRGNVLVGLYGIWHGSDQDGGRTIDLGFLLSNDGVRFREPIRDWVFLERGRDGAWDQGGLLQGQGFENVGERTYVYDGSWDPRVGYAYTPRGGLGLATLERDRFGALAPRDAGAPAGFVTAPLAVQGPLQVWVNVDGIDDGARIRVELLDEVERPLGAFSGAHAGVVNRSGLRVPVEWNGRREIRELRAPFRIRVVFERARAGAPRCYALYVGG